MVTSLHTAACTRASKVDSGVSWFDVMFNWAMLSYIIIKQPYNKQVLYTHYKQSLIVS